MPQLGLYLILRIHSNHVLNDVEWPTKFERGCAFNRKNLEVPTVAVLLTSSIFRDPTVHYRGFTMRLLV